ncbi:MAG: TonB-dependent receptor, partial [Gammaproteobacteria bacterium]|nr:TonB-dependent receptor [Gammaproteobacteria bacterium]
HLSFAQTSQVPGYTALKSNPSGLFGGNADLGREKTDSFELGIEMQRPQWQWQNLAFYRQEDDLVDWTFDSSSPNSRQANAVDIEVIGFESVFTKRWSRASVVAGYTYLDKHSDYGSAAVDSSFYALNYARHRATVVLKVSPSSRWDVNFFQELRSQAANALRGSSDDAYNAALSVDWRPRIGSDLTINGTIDNLTNSNFEEFPGTPASRRQVSLTARYLW